MLKTLLSEATELANDLINEAAEDAKELLSIATEIAEVLLARVKLLEGILPICTTAKRFVMMR